MNSSASIVFTGDIGFDKYMDHKWNDPDLIAPDVLDFLHGADHVCANVEGALLRQEKKENLSGTAQLLHTMDPDAAEVLSLMHADIWNLCNNHIMDAGAQGVEATLREAEKYHAQTIGAGRNLEEAAKPLILPDAGGIGIFSVGYRRGCKPAGENQAGCLLWNQMDLIQKNIDLIKRTCRWCVIVSHGGEEFTSLPSPYTRERYHRFLDMGADLVVSHHPHVPMNYERVGEKIIFYSLGNFIFDTDYQRAQFNTDLGILVRLDFTPEKYSWKAMGLRIDREKEHVVPSPLPRIFEDVQEEDYKLLEPLSAKAMIAAYKRQQIFLKPREYASASEEKWRENFLDEKRSGRVPGEALDFRIILPIAEKEEQQEWRKSHLEKVKEYILEQM